MPASKEPPKRKTASRPADRPRRRRSPNRERAIARVVVWTVAAGWVAFWIPQLVL